MYIKLSEMTCGCYRHTLHGNAACELGASHMIVRIAPGVRPDCLVESRYACEEHNANIMGALGESHEFRSIPL